MVEQAPEAILIYDVDLERFTDANEKAESLFGCNRDELLRLGPTHFYPPDQPDHRPVDVSFAEHNKRALQEGLVYERRIRSHKGREAICEVRLGRLPSATGRLLRASFIDITERKMAEAALRGERDFSTNLIASLPGSFILIDERGRLIRWNDGVRTSTGLSDQQLQGLDAMSIVVEKDRDRTREKMQEAFNRGFADVEVGVLRQNGDVQTIHYTARAITNERDQPCLLAVGTDVTGQRVAEKYLRESEERFRSIFDSIDEGIIVMDVDTGAFLAVNPRLCEIFGYQHTEMLQLDLEVLSAGVSPYTIEDASPLLKRAASGEAVRIEWLCKAKDGHHFWMEVSLRRALFGGREVVLAAARDITERKQADATIRRQADQYATMLTTTADGFWVLDKDGKFIDANDNYCRVTGYSHADLLTMGIQDVEVVESRETTNRHLARVMSIHFERFESQHRRKDGSAIDIECSVSFWRQANQFLCFGRDITDRKKIERRLAYSNIVLAATIDSSPEGMLVADNAGKILSYNQPFLKMWRIPENLARMGIDDAVLRACATQIKDTDQFVARVNYLYQHPSELEHAEIEFKDGRIFDRQTTGLRQPNGDYIGRIWFFLDITERRKIEQTLADSELRLKTVLQTNVDGIAIMDVATKKFTFANQALCELLGYDFDEVTSIGVEGIHPFEVLPKIRQCFDGSGRGEKRVFPNLPTKRKDGSIILADVSASAMTLGGRTYMVACFHDVTERKRTEEQIARIAKQDILTGLANRLVFVEVLNQTIARARRDGGNFAVLYLDLDHFKDVNDTLGHPVGDLLLQAVADRLNANVRETDTVARFGGDEFAILEIGIREPADAGIFADKLLRAMREPVLLRGSHVRTGASVGIAVFGADSPDAETLLSHADEALYRAKSEGRGTYRFFTDEMDREVHARVTMGAELHEAIIAGQLFLLYQPQVDVDTGRIVGIEALVRWRHPKRGVVSPSEFIPVAEKSGLIVALGHWVLREACRQMKEWLDAGIAPQLIGVNLSGLQFKNPIELENDVASILAEMILPSKYLELELTESVLMEVSLEHNDVLLRLREAGVRIAIDDFGTGYSSLEYLSRFSVDRIKIAQTFIVDLPAKPRNKAIVKAAIRLANELDLLVVVEGVENAAQLELIRS